MTKSAKGKPKKQIKPGDIVEIIWVDSVGSNGWQRLDAYTPESESKYTRHKTLGYFAWSDKDITGVYQSASLDRPDDKRIDGGFTIPTRAIESIKKI